MAQIKALTPEGRLPTTAVTQVREMVPHPIQDIPTSTDWVRADVDEIGQIATATDSQGRTWINLHPDSPGVVAPAIAAMFRDLDTTEWTWAVSDASGNVALGVRADGTVYPAGGGGSGAQEPYDVILLAGQSNAQGAGRPIFDTDVWPNIDQYPAANKPASGTIIPAVEPLQNPGPLTENIAHGPALFFARDYALRHPGRRVLIVPAAYSGTAFSSVGPDTWDWTSTTGGDNLAVRAVAQTQAALAAAGPGARLAAILWHQGEGDTPSSVADGYEATLEAFITWLRGQLDAPDVPFIIGQMGDERRDDTAGTITVDKAHIGMPARHLRAGFAPAAPAVHNPGDITHMSTRGQMLMAANMWDAYGRALLNTDDGTAPLGVENLAVRSEGDRVRVTWEPSWSRALAYVVEWSSDGVTWHTSGVEQYAPLWCGVTVPSAPGVVHVRVTATNTYGSSAPVQTATVGTAVAAEASTAITPTADWSTESSTVIEARRSGSVVTITAWRLSVNSGATGTVDAYEIPAGYRPPAMYDASTLDSRGKAVRLTNSNIVTITDPSGPVAHHTFTYITTDPFPV